MTVKRILCIAVFFVLLGFAPAEGGDLINVNYPPDNTIMEFGLLSVSLSITEGAADSVIVDINAREQIRIIPKREFVCFTVPISVGANRIMISASKGEKPLDEVRLNVFRRSDLESRYVEAPPGYRRDYFHSNGNDTCMPCHKMEPEEPDKKPVDIAAFPDENLSVVQKEAASTSTCHSCHKRMLSYPFVHGPSGVWSCLSCHDPQAVLKYSVIKPDTRTCFICHLQQKEKWYGSKVLHGPFLTGKCAICHNPHASDHPYTLIKSTWDLCVSCHIEKGSGRHIVEGYFSKGTAFHPTRGVPDPRRKGEELSCSSCHNPHASDAPKLWRFNVGSGFALCRECHGK